MYLNESFTKIYVFWNAFYKGLGSFSIVYAPDLPCDFDCMFGISAYTLLKTEAKKISIYFAWPRICFKDKQTDENANGGNKPKAKNDRWHPKKGKENTVHILSMIRVGVGDSQ